MSATKLLGLALCFALVLHAPPARACTAFAAHTPDGSLVAKSFDWSIGEGWLVHNERGRERSMLFPRAFSPTARWTARYASLTLTTVGPGFPIGGMNEAGLTIESLVDLSREPSMIPEPSALTGLELVQYALDRMQSVAELAEFMKHTRLSQLGVALHFFACDRSGACIVIEGDDAQTEVTSEPRGSFQVLANQPVAQDQAAATASGWLSWLGFAESGADSDNRFVRVAHRVGAVHCVRAAFLLLEQVRSRATRWQVVWDVTRGLVHFRDPGESRSESTFALHAGDPCEGAPRVEAIGAGRVGAAFRWNEAETRRAQERLAVQLGGGGRALRLAREVGAALGSSTCAVSK